MTGIEREEHSDPRRRILKALVRHPGGLTRPALGQVAEVAPTTLGGLLREEGLAGLVVEEKAKRPTGGGGPRPRVVRLRDGLCVAAVEIGHGHVRIAIAGLDGRLWPDADGRYFDQVVMPVYKERRRTLNWIAGGPDVGVGSLSRRLQHVYSERLARSSEETTAKPFVLGVGISVAAPVDPSDGRLVAARPADGLILKEEEGSIACADWDGESAGKGLRDRLLGADAGERFGWALTDFHSDSASELCARAELRDGELSETDLAIFVKWTGSVSAAVVLDGHVIVGSRGLAGGLPLHQLGSGAGSKDRKRLPLGIEVGVRRLRNQIGRELGLREQGKDELLRDYFRAEVLSIAHGERSGLADREIVTRHLRTAAAMLGESLAPTVNMLDPSKVVIGGGVFERRDWPLVAEPLSEGIRREIAVRGKAPDVTLARHQDYPALRGAIISRLDTGKLVAPLLRACKEASSAAAPAPLVGVGGPV